MTRYESICSAYLGTKETYKTALTDFRLAFAEKLADFLECEPRMLALEFASPCRTEGSISCEFDLNISIHHHSNVRVKKLRFLTGNEPETFRVVCEKDEYRLNDPEETKELFEKLVNRILLVCQRF